MTLRRTFRLLHQEKLLQFLASEPRFTWAIGPAWRSVDVAIHLPMLASLRFLFS